MENQKEEGVDLSELKDCAEKLISLIQAGNKGCGTHAWNHAMKNNIKAMQALCNQALA